MLFHKLSVDNCYIVVAEGDGLLGCGKDRKLSSLQQSMQYYIVIERTTEH